MTSNQISEKSCHHFDKAAPDYNIALKNSGFNENITYSKSIQVSNSKETNCLVQSLIRKLMLVKFLWDSFISIFPVTINTIS